MSVGDIVHVALEKQEFLQGLTADYARLHEDPERWGSTWPSDRNGIR